MTDNTPFFDSPAWARAVSRYLKTRKQLHCLRYTDIQVRLQEQFGINQSAANLSKRFSTGVLGAQLFCALLLVSGETTVDLNEIVRFYREEKKA